MKSIESKENCCCKGKISLNTLLFSAVFGGVLLFSVGYRIAVRSAASVFCSNEDLAAQSDAMAVQAQQAGVDPERKRVFLTFDDGPSKNTAEVLKILAQNQVNATFFVVASENNQPYLPLIKQEADQGCQVALHSCTHDYRQIYCSTEAFWADIEALKEQLKDYVDVDEIDCIRFPGGSTNTVSRKYGGKAIMGQLKQQAEDRGYHWIDWNVCAEDAVGGKPSAEQIYQNVISGVKNQKDCIVLMHDTAVTGTTVEALPGIIQWFKENGYVFCTVNELYQEGEKW